MSQPVNTCKPISSWHRSPNMSTDLLMSLPSHNYFIYIVVFGCHFQTKYMSSTKTSVSSHNTLLNFLFWSISKVIIDTSSSSWTNKHCSSQIMWTWSESLLLAQSWLINSFLLSKLLKMAYLEGSGVSMLSYNFVRIHLVICMPVPFMSLGWCWYILGKHYIYGLGLTDISLQGFGKTC